MASSGYIGGNVSMARKQEMIAKYLHPLFSFARDYGVRNQCRCGGTKYIRWRETAILESELGTSLRAAGFEFRRTIKGRNWNCPSRGGRRTDQPMCDKEVWGRRLANYQRLKIGD